MLVAFLEATPNSAGEPSQDDQMAAMLTGSTVELSPSEQVIADAVKTRVSQIFAGVDTRIPGTYGYNTYVDRFGEGTRATNFRDGFLIASLKKGGDFGDPDDVSYGLYKLLLGDPDGYQKAVLFYDNPKRGQRVVSLIKYDNRNPQNGYSMRVEDPAEITKTARDLGLQV